MEKTNESENGKEVVEEEEENDWNEQVSANVKSVRFYMRHIPPILLHITWHTDYGEHVGKRKCRQELCNIDVYSTFTLCISTLRIAQHEAVERLL